MTETEILLQLWADTLADVQADKPSCSRPNGQPRTRPSVCAPMLSGPK